MFRPNLKLFNMFCLSVSYSIYSASQDLYKYETAIIRDEFDKVVTLNHKIELIAKNQNVFGWLNFSKFFDTSKIKNSTWIHKEFISERTYNFKEIDLTTEDGTKILIYFFNRNKGKVILIGPGFTNPPEKMAPFIHLLSEYDVAILNYRGHGRSNKRIYNPFKLLIKKISGVTTETRIGGVEEKDVKAAVDHLKNILGYKEVIGLGICYSTVTFIKAQAIHQNKFNQKLFDKLIVDSPWISLAAFTEKLDRDPMLIKTPQRGGCYNSWLCKNGYTIGLSQKIAKFLLGINIQNHSVIPYLKLIKDTPMLFWYGKNDLTITRDEFEEIYKNAQNSQKIAFITSNPHVINHIKQKELYALACKLFVESESINDFFETINNDQLLKEKLINDYATNI